MKHKVLPLNQISEVGLSYLVKDRYELVKEWSDQPEAAMIRSFVMHDLSLPDSLRAVVRAGAGVNNIPVKECTRKGIVVFNTPGANANAVKELVLSGMLLAVRPVFEGMLFSRELISSGESHEEIEKRMEKEKKRFAGREIAGKTLGVVGLGAIGSKVCEMAISLGMKVVGYDPMLSVDGAIKLSPMVVRKEDLKGLLAESDFVSLHLPALAETKKMFNRELLANFKRGAVLLNYARGELVENSALLAALETGQIAKYVSDFPSVELANHKNVLATPHLGASTNEAEENCALMGVQQLMDFLEHGNVRNSVNVPTLSAGLKQAFRLTVLAASSSPVMNQWSEVFSAHGVKVTGSFSKSNSEVSYSIIDSTTVFSPEVVKAIGGLEGVLTVRVI